MSEGKRSLREERKRDAQSRDKTGGSSRLKMPRDAAPRGRKIKKFLREE